MRKRIISLLLALAMLIGMMPMIATEAEAAEAYLWPIKGCYTMSRGYSTAHSHQGVDIAVGEGTPVLATKSGTVVASSNSCSHVNIGSIDDNRTYCNGGMGNYVKIRHDDGTYSRYMHLRQGSAMAQGTYVKQGTEIGKVSSTGQSTGYHLHFDISNSNDVRIDNNPVNSNGKFKATNTATYQTQVINYIFEVKPPTVMYNVRFDANGGILPAAYKDSTLDGINVERAEGYLVVYNDSGALVDTNKYGVEALIDATGKVIGKRDYLSETKQIVPENGFILSGQGTNGSWVGEIPLGYYVSYDPNLMRVYVYDTKEACEANHRRIKSGSTIGTLPTPTRAGYIFDGWYTSATGGTRVYGDYIVNANTTLYAHWRNDYVNLGSDFYAYMGNLACGHGIAVNGSNVELGARYSDQALWRFIRQQNGSYEIQNCYTGKVLDVYDAGVADWTNVWVYESNNTLAQRWYIRRVGGGYVLHSACSDKALDVYYGSSESAIGDNVQIYTANDSAAQIMYIEMPTLSVNPETISLGVGAGHVIEARVENTFNTDWTFLVEFSNEIVDCTWVKYDTNVYHFTLTPTKAGSTVMRIKLYDFKTANFVTVDTVNISVHDKYTLSFDPMNGMDPECVTGNTGEAIQVPDTIPYYFGHTFLGWGATKNSSTVFCEPMDELVGTADRTFYAIYKDAEAITTTTMYSDIWVSPKYVHGLYWLKYVPSITTSYEIKSIGSSDDNYVYIYDSAGNFVAHDDDSGEELEFKATCTLTAGETYYIAVAVYNTPIEGTHVFVDRGYLITYNANGGTNAPAATYVYSGDGGTLSNSLPTRDGYTFLGWATKANAAVAEYAAGEYVNIDRDTTLYAVWDGPSTDRIEQMSPTLKASNVASTGKIKLSWNKVDGAAKYQIVRSLDNKNWEHLAYSTGTSATNTKTDAGKTYYYKIRAIDANGNKSKYSNVVSRTCDLLQPTVTVTNVASTGKIKLSWNKIEGAAKYQIVRSLDNKNWEHLTYTTNTSTTNTKVDAGKTYYYKVRAVHSVSAATSAYSSVVSRTCDLPQVTGLKATNVTSTGKIKLSWNKVEGAAKYQIIRSLDKTNWEHLSYTTGTSTTNTKTDAGKTYYYKVRAIHSSSAANSAYSSVVSRTCDLAQPTLTVKLNSNGKPTLSWTKVTGAVKYQIVRSTDNKNWEHLAYSTGTSATNTKAVAGTKYYYKVRAIHSNTDATSAYSAVKYITAK